MKRILTLTLALLMLCGCSLNNYDKVNSVADINLKTKEPIFKGIWYSYIELDFAGFEQTEFEQKITEMFNNAKSGGFSAVICQVRANCDASYPSSIFPFSSCYLQFDGSEPTFDPLQIMVETAHLLDLEFHAWINPYRVSAQSKDYQKLPDNSPAKKFLTDENKNNDSHLLFNETGMYLNPASDEVKKLIVDGVEEILQNYDVDGIQFDDYFYPTTDVKFDENSYNEYKKSVTTPLSLQDWRRTHINTLVTSVFKTVHKYENKVFGISPAADISDDNSDKNYQNLYADVKLWCNTKGYIDYIAPQLYFGYNYTVDEFKFINLLEAWAKVPRQNGVKLYIGIGAYKLGTIDANSDEWQTAEGILARQVSDSKLYGADGIMLYSYSYVFNPAKQNQQELNALKKELI